MDILPYSMYCTRYVRVAREMGEIRLFAPLPILRQFLNNPKQPVISQEAASQTSKSRISHISSSRSSVNCCRGKSLIGPINCARVVSWQQRFFSFGNKLTPFGKGGMFHKLRRISSLPLRRTMRGMRPFFFGLAAKPRTYLERNIAIYMPPFSSDGRCSENVQPPTHHIAKKNTKDPSTLAAAEYDFRRPLHDVFPAKICQHFSFILCCKISFKISG